MNGAAAMEKKVMLCWLLSFYGEMLTDNQREMARLHWEEDYSLTEIAQQFSVSRQSVFDTLSRTEKQLETLEEKIRMLRFFRRIEDGLTACQKELDRVQTDQESQTHLNAARSLIEKLLNQEE
ncbi:MAG: DNA-binding protein [Clostridia bacterium]|nr:DNA-binding protein [Clostridia bacterium]MBR6186765.1 DNA-binding protein [Clostridia bacterium]